MCVYKHTHSHQFFPFASFNIVPDIPFFYMDTEDMSVCEGTFFLSGEYYTDNGSALDWDVIWYVYVT